MWDPIIIIGVQVESELIDIILVKVAVRKSEELIDSRQPVGDVPETSV